MVQRFAIGLALSVFVPLVALGVTDLYGAGGRGSGQETAEVTGDSR